MATVREIQEGRIKQGVNETIVYTITTTPWGANPTDVSVDVFQFADTGWGESVKDTVMPTGSPSVTDDVITLPPLTALTEDEVYRIEVNFTSGVNIFTPYAIIQAER